MIDNQRRCDLIDKEIDGVITSEEAEELAILQNQMLVNRHEVASLPLEALRKLHSELKKKLK